MKILPKFIEVLLIVGFASNAFSQISSCNIERIDSDSVRGVCSGVAPPKLQLKKGGSTPDVLWQGSLSENELIWPIEIASYNYSGGPEIIIRTPIGWFPLGLTNFDSVPSKIEWNIQTESPPSKTDIEILKGAKQYLSDQDVWDRNDDRNCDNKSKISLYCALAKATQDVMGSYQHRQPVMQIVRKLIQTNWQDRLSGHRLMDFNNHKETSFSDIQQLFQLTELEINKNVQ